MSASKRLAGERFVLRIETSGSSELKVGSRSVVDRLELLIARLQAERRAARTEAQLRREVRRG